MKNFYLFIYTFLKNSGKFYKKMLIFIQFLTIFVNKKFTNKDKKS